MRLARVGEIGAEKPGILDADGQIRDLSGVVSDLAGSALSRDGLDAIRQVDPMTLPLLEGRLGAPVAGTRNFVGIGLNYADHAKEQDKEPPEEPVIFMKSPSSICGPNDGIIIPKGSTHVDWEVELAVIIGETARSVSEADALDYVAGFAACNDVSERHWQNDRGGSWDKGKGFDNFGSIGPWLVTRDEIDDPHDLDMFLEIDGERMQTGNTSTMIFKIPKLVAYASYCFTLNPGDIIATGTPPGVGFARTPPRFLQSGETVRLGLEGLGEQVQPVRNAG